MAKTHAHKITGTYAHTHTHIGSRAHTRPIQSTRPGAHRPIHKTNPYRNIKPARYKKTVLIHCEKLLGLP